MTIQLEIPGEAAVKVDHLLLDVNGTLTNRGQLLDGVSERLSQLREVVEVQLLSADTFGTLDQLSTELGVKATRVQHGSEKRALAIELGADRCAAVGNGRNDAEMFSVVKLALAVVGAEGAASATLVAADAVFTSVVDALDLLLEPSVAASTLRR
jgi:soluble P-type ATPase